MHPKLQLKMRKNIGLENTKKLIPIFDSLNIGEYEDDIIVESNLIKVPKSAIKNFKELIAKIENLSLENEQFVISTNDLDLLIKTTQFVEAKEITKDIELSSYSHIISNIFIGESKHYIYGKEWVANRNIVSTPDGELIVLNNPDDPYNTIHPGDVIQFFKLGKNFQQLGNLWLLDEDSKLNIHCEFGRGMEEEQDVQMKIKEAIKMRAEKEINQILEKKHAEEISHADFDHGHPISDPKSPDKVYILYHTYEHSKPKLK